MAENIKLKDLYNEEQSFADIGTIAVPKTDGSGNTYYVQRPLINYTLQDPPTHELTDGVFALNMGDGTFFGESDPGNFVGSVAGPTEGKNTKPIAIIRIIKTPVTGVTETPSRFTDLLYLYEHTSSAVLLEILNIESTAVFTAQPGWGQMLYDKDGAVTGYAQIADPAAVSFGIQQPNNLLNESNFYALLSEVTQDTQSVSVTENGAQTIVPTAGKSGIRKLALNVNVPSSGGNLQEKSVSITSNGTTEVTPDAGYDGMNKVTAVVNVAGGGGGVQANWAQNDSTAADYVKNRPGAYIQTVASHTLTFDGDVTGKNPYDGSVKISNEIIPKEALQSGTFTVTIHKAGGTEVVTVSGAEFYDELGIAWGFNTEGTDYLLVITKEYEIASGLPGMAGTYLGCDTENNPPQWYVSEFATIPEYSVTAELPEAYTQAKQADWAAAEDNLFGPTDGAIKNRIGGFASTSFSDLQGLTLSFDGTYEGKEHYILTNAEGAPLKIFVKALDTPLTKSQLQMCSGVTLTHGGTSYDSTGVFPHGVYVDTMLCFMFLLYAKFAAEQNAMEGLASLPFGAVLDFTTYVPPGTYWVISASSPNDYFTGASFNSVPVNLIPSEFLDVDFVDRDVSAKSVILQSSTANSTKKFKITVDDTGTLTATEVTN